MKKDIKAGKDVSTSDYLAKKKKKSYKNNLSNLGLDISKGISFVFNKTMDGLFKLMEEAINS